MPTFKQIVEQSDTRLGRLFDLFIQSLIVLSLISFSIGTLPGLSIGVKVWLRRLEFVIVLIFTIEYVLRACLSRPRHRYVFSFLGIIDLAAVLPFYLTIGLDLRSLRALRLLRLFHILKLARYSSAIRKFHVALILAKEEILLFLALTAILLFLTAVGIYYFERDAQPEAFSSVFHSLWWAVATLTTVGYGDVYPVTTGGKIFTFFILIIGLGIVSVPAGLVASSLEKARDLENEDSHPAEREEQEGAT
ncbi:MAG: ion transporter [Phycisphaerales bacterium]|nr:ion transporter [Phycisphaerales bacterium]